MIGILSTIVKLPKEVMTKMYIAQESRSINFRKTKTPFRNSYFKIQMLLNVGAIQQHLNNKSFDEKKHKQ
jgi:flagellar biosynthesis regulator FlbT